MAQFFLLVLIIAVSTAGCDALGREKVDVGPRKDMLEPVNKARTIARACGSRQYESAMAVTWNDKLAEAALRHAQDVALTGKVGHVGSDSTGPDTRVRDTGYSFEFVGEILATGSRSADEVMEGFLNSPGHCSVLMSDRYSEAGAAIAGGRVWTIVFASPK